MDEGVSDLLSFCCFLPEDADSLRRKEGRIIERRRSCPACGFGYLGHSDILDLRTGSDGAAGPRHVESWPTRAAKVA